MRQVSVEVVARQCSQPLWRSLRHVCHPPSRKGYTSSDDQALCHSQRIRTNLCLGNPLWSLKLSELGHRCLTIILHCKHNGPCPDSQLMTPAIWARPDFLHHLPSPQTTSSLVCILLLPSVLGWRWERLSAQGLKNKLMLEV